MTADLKAPKIKKLNESQRVEFGTNAHYHPLLADGDTPIRTGIQTSEPGYVAPMHSHPYLEVLHILEGEADAWLEGGEDNKVRLSAGDCIALPPNIPHSFSVVGDKTMRLLGIHHNPDRIVNYKDQESGPDGYPVVDPDLQPKSATA